MRTVFSRVCVVISRLSGYCRLVVSRCMSRVASLEMLDLLRLRCLCFVVRRAKRPNVPVYRNPLCVVALDSPTASVFLAGRMSRSCRLPVLSAVAVRGCQCAIARDVSAVSVGALRGLVCRPKVQVTVAVGPCNEC
jgi:hypothetical protein